MSPTQRGSKRVPFRYRIRYGDGEDFSFGYTHDLSLNGVGLYGKRVLPPRTRIQIHLEMNEIPLKVEGVVVHAKSGIPGHPARMGIKFSQCPAMIRALYNMRINRR